MPPRDVVERDSSRSTGSTGRESRSTGGSFGSVATRESPDRNNGIGNAAANRASANRASAPATNPLQAQLDQLDTDLALIYERQAQAQAALGAAGAPPGQFGVPLPTAPDPFIPVQGLNEQTFTPVTQSSAQPNRGGAPSSLFAIPPNAPTADAGALRATGSVQTSGSGNPVQEELRNRQLRAQGRF